MSKQIQKGAAALLVLLAVAVGTSGIAGAASNNVQLPARFLVSGFVYTLAVFPRRFVLSRTIVTRANIGKAGLVF